VPETVTPSIPVPHQGQKFGHVNSQSCAFVCRVLFHAARVRQALWAVSDLWCRTNQLDTYGNNAALGLFYRGAAGTRNFKRNGPWGCGAGKVPKCQSSNTHSGTQRPGVACGVSPGGRERSRVSDRYLRARIRKPEDESSCAHPFIYAQFLRQPTS
jgi:hypothetical protein